MTKILCVLYVVARYKMKVEHKHILINSNNIREYRKQGALVGGSHTSGWDFFNNKKVADSTVTVYNYSFEPELCIHSSDKVYQAAKKINSEQENIAVHEIKHAKNADQGLPFHLASGVCWTHVALYCLDELSARIDEALYSINNTKLKSVYSQFLDCLGVSQLERAVSIALKRFAPLFQDYCMKGVSSFENSVQMANFSEKDLQAFLQSQQRLYSCSFKMSRPVLYSISFHEAVGNYFRFDSIPEKNVFSRQAAHELRSFWTKCEPEIMRHSKDCISRMLQKTR